jgi:CheY-like chemotaxis protein
MADILVVDDEAAVRWVVSDALRRAGHACREATDGTAALASVREREPDLVLCDLRMPRLDGFGFLRQLAPPGRVRPPVVFLTSHDDAQAMDEAKGSGAFDYLVKPCEEALLRSVVERALSQGPTTALETPAAPSLEGASRSPADEAPPARTAYVVAVPAPHAGAPEAAPRGWKGVLRRIFAPRE